MSMFFRKLILAALGLIAAVSVPAKTDTLDRVSEMINKIDSVPSFSIFHKFTWNVGIRRPDGTFRQCVTTRPDSLFNEGRVDTVYFSTSFFVVPGLRNKTYSLRYDVEGSVRIKMNGQVILETGVLQSENRENKKQILDGYYDIVFIDSIQALDITYLPHRKTKVFDMQLKISAPQLAEEKRLKVVTDSNESYGIGFYYLAFGIVFLILFAFFREKTENLYFSMFCIFAALSFLWDSLKTDILYNLSGFFGIFCFEFLAIFFYKVIRNKEKPKWPLLVIAATFVLCFLPVIRYNYVSLFDHPLPLLLGSIYVILYGYAWIASFFFLVQGIGKKQWEARTILVICFVPVALFILVLIVFILVSSIKGSNDTINSIFSMLVGYLYKAIIYIYPLAAVFILGKRNGLNQKQLIAQVKSIQRLSDENLAKEQEKQHILENQKGSLEREVAARTAEIMMQKEEIEKQHDELKVEKRKSDDLLRNILPEEVADELKEKGFSEAKHFDNVSVLFADFVDFTKAGETMSPQELVSELHMCFKNFDEIISRYGIEKIKTIGDAYLAVCGLPVANGDHAALVVRAAAEINEFMMRRQEEMKEKTFKVRIGIHSGSVVAGIVGVKKFAYDIWGDTVNTAARMEQNSEAGRINISQTTYDLVRDEFDCTYRGEIDAKNKGKMKMYFAGSAKG